MGGCISELKTESAKAELRRALSEHGSALVDVETLSHAQVKIFMSVHPYASDANPGRDTLDFAENQVACGLLENALTAMEQLDCFQLLVLFRICHKRMQQEAPTYIGTVESLKTATWSEDDSLNLQLPIVVVHRMAGVLLHNKKQQYSEDPLRPFFS